MTCWLWMFPAEMALASISARRGAHPTCRFVFLTASDEEMNIIMGLDIGGDDYLTKPFKLGVLLSRVNALLRVHMRPARETRTGIVSIAVRLCEDRRTETESCWAMRRVQEFARFLYH